MLCKRRFFPTQLSFVNESMLVLMSGFSWSFLFHYFLDMIMEELRLGSLNIGVLYS